MKFTATKTEVRAHQGNVSIRMTVQATDNGHNISIWIGNNYPVGVIRRLWESAELNRLEIVDLENLAGLLRDAAEAAPGILAGLVGGQDEGL